MTFAISLVVTIRIGNNYVHLLSVLNKCVEWLQVVLHCVIVCLYSGLFHVCRVTLMCNSTLRFSTFMNVHVSCDVSHFF